MRRVRWSIRGDADADRHGSMKSKPPFESFMKQPIKRVMSDSNISLRRLPILSRFMARPQKSDLQKLRAQFNVRTTGRAVGAVHIAPPRQVMSQEVKYRAGLGRLAQPARPHA